LAFADRPTHHPLPVLPLRRGVVFMAVAHVRRLTGTRKP